MSLPLDWQPINEALSVEQFDCGVEALNRYLKHHALVNHQRGIGKTFVACAKGDPLQRPIAYFTVTPAQISPQQLPNRVARGLPNYPVPAGRLARLAVSARHQGRGLGGRVLMAAVSRLVTMADEYGGYLIIVDAKDEMSANFYRKYGFMDSSVENTLIMAIKWAKRSTLFAQMSFDCRLGEENLYENFIPALSA